LKPESVSTKQERIAELARMNPAMAFTSLNQYLDYEWLYYAWAQTRKDGAVGVDGQTAEEYAANLEQNLLSLIDRINPAATRRRQCEGTISPRAMAGSVASAYRASRTR